MPIPFTCPNCGAQTSVAEQYAGMEGPCATCGKTIRVPSPADKDVSPAAATTTAGRRSRSWLLIAVLGSLGLTLPCLFGVLIALLLPAINAAREASRRAACNENVSMIVIAMQEYHLDHGCYPPAYIPDEDGEPKHSWRVLLLPYLGHELLWERYDFDEPWNGPNNAQLIAEMPDVYGCRTDPAGFDGHTSYVVAVGPTTPFPGPEPTSQRDWADAPTETVLVIELADSGIVWLEPRDLDAESFEARRGSASGRGRIGGFHLRGGGHLGTDAGDSIYVQADVYEEIVDALFHPKEPASHEAPGDADSSDADP